MFAKSPYLLYNIILCLSMSIGAQIITIFYCALCALYTLWNTQVPHREAPFFSGMHFYIKIVNNSINN